VTAISTLLAVLAVLVSSIWGGFALWYQVPAATG